MSAGYDPYSVCILLGSRPSFLSLRPRFCFRTRLGAFDLDGGLPVSLPVVHSHEALLAAMSVFQHHLRLHHANQEAQPSGLHLHWMMPGQLTADASLACCGTDSEQGPCHRSTESALALSVGGPHLIWLRLYPATQSFMSFRCHRSHHYGLIGRWRSAICPHRSTMPPHHHRLRRAISQCLHAPAVHQSAMNA